MASEANWNSFDSSMQVEESDVVISHFFGVDQFANEHNQDSNIGTQPMFWSDHHNSDSYYTCDHTNYNPYYWSQGNCSTASTSSFPYENYFLADLNAAPEMMATSSSISNFNAVDEQTAQMVAPEMYPIRAYDHLNGTVSEEAEEGASGSLAHHPQQTLQAKRRLHLDDKEKPQTEGEDCQMENPKKKVKAPANVAKKGKNVQSKKWHKSASTSNLTEINAQSSGCYSSEDDSNASQEPNGAGDTSYNSKGTLTANGKTRAGRGSATDPQSLYARKRREKINERLRILQNLVPNGTKVDISTMLEEAVEYVKFLQTQIKLLSSDDLWMYAPIAYNGMNLRLDLMISPPSKLPNGTDSAIHPRQ